MVYRSPVSRSAKRPWSSLDFQKVGRREPSAPISWIVFVCATFAAVQRLGHVSAAAAAAAAARMTLSALVAAIACLRERA